MDLPRGERAKLCARRGTRSTRKTRTRRETGGDNAGRVAARTIDDASVALSYSAAAGSRAASAASRFAAWISA